MRCIQCNHGSVWQGQQAYYCPRCDKNITYAEHFQTLEEEDYAA